LIVFEGFCFLRTRGAIKRDAMSANSQGEARTSRSAPNIGCPDANLELGLTDNSIQVGPSEVCHPNIHGNLIAFDPSLSTDNSVP
jgi:hypothetical protein